jgi:SAM-dependent methyltransferase
MGDYVHGYSERETERLVDQSGILKNLLHADSKFPAKSSILEAGCGVGAQTRILASQNPGSYFTSIDISEKSLEKAKITAREAGLTNVSFSIGNILSLEYENESFDHVFVCFVLEHLESPLTALNELKRVLKPGGTIIAIEGDHGSCFWHPETEKSLKVWNTFIQVQKDLGHDPNIGRRLSPLISSAGFNIIHSSPRWVYGDLIHLEILDGMVNKIIVPMLQTGRQQALSSGYLTESEWDSGIADIERSGELPGGTFFYTWFKVVAEKSI